MTATKPTIAHLVEPCPTCGEPIERASLAWCVGPGGLTYHSECVAKARSPRPPAAPTREPTPASKRGAAGDVGVFDFAADIDYVENDGRDDAPSVSPIAARLAARRFTEGTDDEGET